MYNFISKKIVSNLIKNKYITNEKKESYEYCFEIFLSTATSISILLCISITINLSLPSVLFLLSFILCRMCFGGYHAKKHSTCFLATITNYLIFIVGINVLQQVNSLFIFLILNLLSILLVHILAPIENKNNPLSPLHKKKLKHLSYIVAYSLFILSLVMFLLKSIPNWISYSLLIGLLSAAIAMLLGWLETYFIERRTVP